MAQRNDQVFQLSLTEIAFTITFLLLLLLGHLVFKEQSERQAAEAELAKVQTAERTTAALNTIKSELASQLQKNSIVNPDEIISKLVAAEQIRTERNQLRQRVDDLDAKLTALTELKQQLEQATASTRPDITQGEVLSALATQNQLRRQLKEKFDKDLPVGTEGQLIQEVVAAAKSYGDLAKAGQNPEAIKKENSDLRGQVAFLKDRLDAKGGRGYPPCWADESGKVEYLFAVEVRPGSVSVAPAWPARREAAAKALPGMDAVLSGRHVNQAFAKKIQGIFNWSKTQDPECRHYVQLKSTITDAIQSDRARLMIENFFYKVEVRR